MCNLRRTHATMLLEAKVNPKIVSERLEPASVSLTLDSYLADSSRRGGGGVEYVSV